MFTQRTAWQNQLTEAGSFASLTQEGLGWSSPEKVGSEWSTVLDKNLDVSNIELIVNIVIVGK